MDEAKLDRLDQYLASNDLESAWFADPWMFAWLTGGSNLIAREGGPGVAAAGYDGESVTLVTDNIEAGRLLAEEVPSDLDVETFEWYEGDLLDAVGDVAPTPAAADVDVDGFDSIERSDLTQPLVEADVERYREVGRDTAAAVEEVTREVEPSDTERELATELYRALHVRDIESPVVLVGGEERLQQWRHFTPKDVEVGGYAVLTVVGARRGLNAAVTRTVAFDGAPDWLEDRYEDVCRVAASAAAATQEVGREGGTAADVFEGIQDAYAGVGLEGEWQNHHQGGALGYASREWTANPGAEAPVELPMAFGWNPTQEGAKTEDTILVSDDDVEVLSDTGDFPTRTVRAVNHDLELTIPDVLWK